MKAASFRARICCHKFSVLSHGFPLVFAAFSLALPTPVSDTQARRGLIKQKVCPYQGLMISAPGARHIPFLLRGFLKFLCNTAYAFVARRADNNRFLIPKSCLAFLPQQKRVPFGSGTGRITVHLIRQQDLDWTARKAGRAVCTDDRYVAARKVLFQDGIACISAFCVNEIPEYRRIPQHRGQEILAECLPHFQRRLHNQYRGWRIMHEIPQHIHKHCSLSDLGRTHDNNFPCVRISDCIHNFPLVWCLVRMPAPRFCAIFRA